MVNRKVWGGNRTERGAEHQGRLMTFLRTANQQGADAIAMLVDLARAPAPGVAVGLSLRPADHTRKSAVISARLEVAVAERRPAATGT